MKTVDLKTAASHIRQACDDSRQWKLRLPFFFLVGAGISHPPVPLASEIESECRNVAARYKRLDDPPGIRPIDNYSHWFGRAYPQPGQRQAFLRGLIENKLISHANLRLAHLMLGKTITNLVVTPNFDDLLSRALTLFGRPHIICDHPSTVERIDPEQDDLQLLHVHGTYWFYDCCNLRGEVQERAKPSSSTTATMASKLDSILAHRAPLVIGYSGWEGDVFMTALQRRLQTRLPFNLYWFCHSLGSPKSLPDWLKLHEDVYFVIPSTGTDAARVVAAASGKEQESESQAELHPGTQKRESSDEKRNEATLSAEQVLDELIQAFELDAPELTVQPLSFFAKHLRHSLPHGDARRAEADFYFIDSVIRRIERARQKEKDNIQFIESKLESVRDALRRSQYKEGITSALSISIEDLSETQLNELMTAMWTASLRLSDNSPEELKAYEQTAAVARGLLRIRPTDLNAESKLVKSRIFKGMTLGILGRNEEALAAYDEVLEEFGERDEFVLKDGVAVALSGKATRLRLLGKAEDAIGNLDEIVKRFLRSTEPGLQGRAAQAFLDKANIRLSLKGELDAIGVYDELVELYGGSTSPKLRAYAARALNRKGGLLESLNRTEDSLKAYDDVVERFADGAEPPLREQVVEALRKKGDRLIFLNRREEALAAFQRALQADEKNMEAVAGLGNVYRALGRYESAIATLQSLLDDDSQYANAHISLAAVFLDLGRYSDAESALKQAIAIRPKHVRARIEITDLYGELGEFDKAREACEKYGEIVNKDCSYTLQAATIESLAANYVEAVNLFEKTIALRPTSLGPAYNNLGDVYRELREYEKATESYELALQHKSKNANDGLGLLQLDLGQLESAEMNFLKAIQARPNEPNVQFNLGLTFGLMGRQENACERFSEVLSSFPLTFKPSNIYARIGSLAGLGRFDEAKRLLEQFCLGLPQLNAYVEEFLRGLEFMKAFPRAARAIDQYCEIAKGIVSRKRAGEAPIG